MTQRKVQLRDAGHGALDELDATDIPALAYDASGAAAAAASGAASALSTHDADTTAVHGIADTSALIKVDDPAGGGLTGYYPNPQVVDDGHAHTAVSLPAVPAIDATGAATDITTRNVSTTAHGLAPKLPNDATKYFDGIGGYTVPPGTGLTNPMTTAADLIVGGASGVPARLAKGSDSQVLTVDPTTHLLVWATPTGGATYATPAIVLGTAAAAGAAGTGIRSDATLLAFDATGPAAVGTAAVGAATVAARRDHVHATGAGTPSTQAFGDAAATGSGPAAAMTDHKHAMPASPALPAEGRSKNTFDTAFTAPGVDFVGVGTLVLTAAQTYYYPIYVATSITLDRLVCEVTAAGAAGKLIQLGIYNADVDWQPTTLLIDGGTVVADGATGVRTKTVSQVLAPGRYHLALNTDGTPTLRVYRSMARFMGFLSTMGTSPFFSRASVASQTVIGTGFNSTGVAWSNYTGASVGFDYAMFVRVSVP